MRCVCVCVCVCVIRGTRGVLGLCIFLSGFRLHCLSVFSLVVVRVGRHGVGTLIVACNAIALKVRKKLVEKERKKERKEARRR
jgi:hypothetical protein